MWKNFVILVFLHSLYGIELVKSEEQHLENNQVSCLINITTMIAKTTCKLRIQSRSSKPESFYSFYVFDEIHHAVFSNEFNETLLFSAKRTLGRTVYHVEFHEPIQNSEVYILRVDILYPKKIERDSTDLRRVGDPQRLIWRGNYVFYSKYYTVSYRYAFLTDDEFNKDLEFSPPYHAFSENQYFYSHYDIAPRTSGPLQINFINTNPIFTVKRLVRGISVSQYGIIWVEDFVEVHNTGSPLNTTAIQIRGKVHWMYTNIHPASINTSITFLDEHREPMKFSLVDRFGKKALEFLPKFRLSGGILKSKYSLLYQLPLEQFLRFDGDSYYLKIRAIDHVLDEVTMEIIEVHIALPIGATYIHADIPTGFSKPPKVNLSSTMLSAFGRQTLNFDGEYLLNFHINDVLVKYRHPFRNFLIVPLQLFMLVFMWFITFWIWWRGGFLGYAHRPLN